MSGISTLNTQGIECGTGLKCLVGKAEQSSLASEYLDRARLPYLQPWGLLGGIVPSESIPDEQVGNPLGGYLLEDGLLEDGRLEDGRLEDGTHRRHWWLLYTKSRQEKKVAEQLASRNVPHFLPVVDRKSLSRGKTRIAKVPLFSGYLFLWGNEQERVHALQTNRLCSIDKVADGEQLRNDLLQIAKLISLGAPLTQESRLATGQRFRVKSGKFVGFEGTVIKRSGKTHLFVAINYMQMGASMKIHDYMLESI